MNNQKDYSHRINFTSDMKVTIDAWLVSMGEMRLTGFMPKDVIVASGLISQGVKASAVARVIAARRPPIKGENA